MKRLLCCVLLAAAVFSLCGANVFAATPPEIDAKGAIVKEITTGTVLYEYNADERLYPASLTKIMTAILALENLDPASDITVSSAAINPLVNAGVHAYLLPGEVISFNSLFEYLLIPSGNDAANAFAVAVGGSVSEFVDMMNAKALDIGCTGTHFANPHGLHDDEHYSTARDILIMSEYAMQKPLFAETVKKTSMTLPITNKHKSETVLNTTNSLLSRGSYSGYTYEGTIGIKTGSTTPAGLCLSAALQKDGLTYYSVVLGCTTAADGTKGQFASTAKLFDYVTKNFSIQTMITQTTPVKEIAVTMSPDGESVILLPKQNLSALLPGDFSFEEVELVCENVPESIEAPLEKGQEVGQLRLIYRGKDYGVIPLVSSSDFTRSGFLSAMSALKSFFTSKGFIFAVIVLLVLAALIIAAFVARGRSRRKKYRRYGAGRYRR